MDKKEVNLIEEEATVEVTETTETSTEVVVTEQTTEAQEAATTSQPEDSSITIVEERSAAVSSSRNGKATFCFITIGKGTSGFYTDDVLKASAHLFEGRPMYMDHNLANKSEPGILYWVGDIQSSYYDSNGIDGAGIYGTATVFPRWKDVVEGMVDSKGGVSIKAKGKTDENGLVKAISYVESVDYVVRAGRGGRVMELFESAVIPVTSENKEQEMTTSAEIKETTEAQGTETGKEAGTTQVTESAEIPASTKTDAPVIDMDAIKKVITEAVSAAVKPVDDRLALIEREATDRDVITKTIKEAAGEDLTEDMCKHIESMVWVQRREGVDLVEQSKTMVESLKPMFKAIKDEADKKIEEAKKEASAKGNVPTILERMNDTFAGKEGEELKEEDLEAALAKSLAHVVGTENVTRIQETIVSSRGE